MDNIISKGLVYGDHPSVGIYFTIIIEYNAKNPILANMSDVSKLLVSSPIKTFDEAMIQSHDIAELFISEKFNDATLVDIESDEYHYAILDATNTPILRIGIEIHDNRKKVFH